MTVIQFFNIVSLGTQKKSDKEDSLAIIYETNSVIEVKKKACNKYRQLICFLYN